MTTQPPAPYTDICVCEHLALTHADETPEGKHNGHCLAEVPEGTYGCIPFEGKFLCRCAAFNFKYDLGKEEGHKQWMNKTHADLVVELLFQLMPELLRVEWDGEELTIWDAKDENGKIAGHSGDSSRAYRPDSRSRDILEGIEWILAAIKTAPTAWLTNPFGHAPLFWQQQRFKCLRCGNDTAQKQRDIQGWDGYCSNCGMIAQGEVGEAVEVKIPTLDDRL